MKKLEELRDRLGCDTISKRGYIITVRTEFFYKHGNDARSYKEQIEYQLLQLGLSFDIIEYGEEWKSFNGGASVTNSSHWYVKFEII